MLTFEDHKQRRLQWLLGAEAEYQGFSGARLFERPIQFSKDEYVQKRYLQGFEDGKTILREEEVAARCASAN